MKTHLPRRFLAVVAALCLVFAMLPMAFASPEPVLPATTGDAAQVDPNQPVAPPATDIPSASQPVAPPATDIPSASQPVAPPATDIPSASQPVAPSPPDIPPGEPPVAPPATDVPPADQPAAPPATDVPPADQPAVLPNVLMVTTGNAVAFATRTLTVTFNDDTPGVSTTNNAMKTAVDNAVQANASLNGNWRNADSIAVTGTATKITGYNWDYLRAMMFYLNYGGTPFAQALTGPTTLDLSGMTGLTTIETGNNSGTSVGNADGSKPGVDFAPRTVILPASLASIGDNAFVSCPALQTISSADFSKLTEVGAQSFDSCTWLTWSNLPDSITSIGMNAFASCTHLALETLPANLQTIGNWSFQDAEVTGSGMSKTLTIPASLKTIPMMAFRRVKKMERLVFPADMEMTDLQPYAFYLCTSLKTIALPKSAATVGASIFAGCTALDSIEIPSSFKIGKQMFAQSGVKHVAVTGDDAVLGTQSFLNCPNLVSVSINGANPQLDTSTFDSCAALKTVTVTKTDSQGALIGTGADKAAFSDKAFAGCDNLESVAITGNSLKFDSGAFSGAFKSSKSSAVTVTVTGDNATFGEKAFEGCKKLTGVTVNGNNANFGKNAFLNSFAESAGNDVSVTVNGNGANFGQNAFEGCKKLTSVTVNGANAVFGQNAFFKSFAESAGNNVSVIVNGSGANFGANAFESCKKLTSVTVKGDSAVFGTHAFLNSFAESSDSADDVAVNIMGNNAHLSANAFEGCKKLRNVKITSDGMRLGDNAFFKSFQTSTSKPGKGVAVELIGDHIVLGNNVFDQCVKLQSVTGKGQAPQMGNNTFNQCAALTNVLLLGKEPNTSADNAVIGDNTFNKCDALTEITIHGNKMALGARTFNECQKLGRITVEGSEIAFGLESFNGCKALTTVDVKGDHVTFGTKSFNDCTALQNVNVSGSYAEFGDQAFTNCTSLENLAITGKEGHTTLGEQVFVNCPKVKNLILSGESTILKPRACYQNTSIETVVAPGNNLQVGESAFAGCTSLTTANFQGDKPVIGNTAFDGDAALKTVNFKENSSPQIGDYAFRGCTSLQSPSLSGSTTVIGKGAFENSTTITTVTLSAGATIGEDAFKNCVKLASVDVGKNIQIKASAFEGCDALTAINLSYGPDRTFQGLDIGANAFKSCDALKSVSVTGDNLKIGDSAFVDCTSLTTLELPGVSPQIGASAFAGCTSLTKTDQNGSTTLLLQGKPAPNAAANVSAFSLETGGPVLGANAFAGTNFEEIKFTGASPVIGASAFANCPNLTKVWFNFSDDLSSTPYASDPPQIGANAFAGCAKLLEVWFDSYSPTFTAGVTPETCFPNNSSSPVFFGKKKMQDQGAFDAPTWDGMRQANRLVIYDESSLIPAQFVGIKDSYNVWDTLNFEVKAADIKNAAPGQLRAYPPTNWEFYAPSKTVDPWNHGEAPYYPGAAWTAGGPYTGVIYPAQRPYGIWTARAYSNVEVFYKDSTTPAGQAGSWHNFNRWGNGNMPNEQRFEFLPPPTPSEANYQLTVLGGGGSGYYAADVSALLSPKPPVSGAKFLRWELKSGTGKLDDPASPQTRFTMAVGPSTVEAVYGAANADKPGKPLPTPKPTPSPPTGDPGLPGAAALLLLAAGVGLGWSKTLRRAKAPAKQRGK